MEDMEYIGLTPMEAVLIRCLIYPAIEYGFTFGPEKTIVNLTDEGKERLESILERLNQIKIES